MKNKDVLEMEKKKIVEQMNQALKENDPNAFSEAFVGLCEKIEENILEQARGMEGEQDVKILAQRGVRQLTHKEKDYYEKVIDAMRSAEPKQSISDINVVMPETIMDSVFEELSTNHPLLSKISGTTVTGLTRMLMNTNGEQKAVWGKLTAKITEELFSGFKEVDVTQFKLSAFLPISKAMLDLGPAWLDRYIREIMLEAYAVGLEEGIVNGTGKEEPIGMTRQVGEGVVVTGGEYPMKEAIKMTALNMEQMGNVTAILTKNSKGQTRTVTNLILLVNPADYWRKVLPATRMLTPDGVYVSTLPVPAEIIQSAAVPEGKAVYGMAGKYFLGVGMAKNGKIEYSDEYRFLEDERVYIIKGYANGFAKDNNAFLLLDISDIKPLRFQVENKTDTPIENADLSDLRIGGLALTPEFAAGTKAYSVTTTDSTNTITAVPKSGTAEISIKSGSATVSNGNRVTWAGGENIVTVTVKDGTKTETYTVTVTKE